MARPGRYARAGVSTPSRTRGAAGEGVTKRPSRHGRRHEKDAASKPAHDVTKKGSFASWPKIVVDGSTSPWPTPCSTAWRNSTSL